MRGLCFRSNETGNGDNMRLLKVAEGFLLDCQAQTIPKTIELYTAFWRRYTSGDPVPNVTAGTCGRFMFTSRPQPLSRDDHPSF
jgi:hypothetical protein